MKHSVLIVRDGAQYTAYEGASIKQAQAHVDTARNALVMTGGTADIQYRLNDRLSTVVTVVDGMFTSQDM